MVLRMVILVVSLVLLAAPERASADMPMFSAREGLAIRGYDTVAYFESGHARAGMARYSVLWKGVVWRFASEANQIRFEMNPWAYVPKFGGYCAFAMSEGQLAAGDPEIWVILDGSLFLMNSAQLRDMWRPQAAPRIARASQFWPSVTMR